MESASDASDTVTRRLLDLHEDLLTNCAAQAADAPTLCRLSCSCKVFERLVLRDAGAAELAWTPALQHARLLALGPDDGSHALSNRPSAALYQAFSNVGMSMNPIGEGGLRWERAALAIHAESAVARGGSVLPEAMRNELRLRALRVIKASLRGRTGAALCRLCGQLLLYGGTLNGNFGPVLGDVLRLDYDATAASLAVREVVVTPPLDDDGHPGARRGHTMTATRLGDGTPVAVVVGGWGYDEIDIAPVMLARPAQREGAEAAQAEFVWTRLQVAASPDSWPPPGPTCRPSSCALLPMGLTRSRPRTRSAAARPRAAPSTRRARWRARRCSSTAGSASAAAAPTSRCWTCTT